MLFSADKFKNLPVMSLQTGSELARTSRAVINPHDLSIVAYELEGRLLDEHPSLLRIADIREIGPMGMIVDSADELIGVGDVLQIEKIYKIKFDLIGLKVIDERKRTVGRVIGYTLEAGNFIIQQIRVKRPFFRSLGDTEFLIHRSQIVEVSDDYIVVKSPDIRHTEPVANVDSKSFENPFRKSPQPHPESIDAS
ncbi:hypothetical protein B7Y94_04090 [Candidatus Saccharibacteria bacterium 32-49-12]|nr:MAG: hypothetical protein B7Y94_04090 [Candidatus Saccharibacteria bacterium 32-49-12]